MLVVLPAPANQFPPQRGSPSVGSYYGLWGGNSNVSIPSSSGNVLTPSAAVAFSAAWADSSLRLRITRIIRVAHQMVSSLFKFAIERI